MDQHPVESGAPRNIWARALLMLLMAIAYHISGTLLFLVALMQFLFVLFADRPSPYLTRFGQSLGCYFQQVVNFQSFVTEELPFPFNPWPSV